MTQFEQWENDMVRWEAELAEMLSESAIRMLTQLREQSVQDEIRKFETGATRDTATGKFEYAGYLSPHFLNGFARYMCRHQTQADGTRRDSDNWQKGMPLDVYVQSAWRHFFDFWAIARGYQVLDEKGDRVIMHDAVMGLVFNLQGYWHEISKKAGPEIYRGEMP